MFLNTYCSLGAVINLFRGMELLSNLLGIAQLLSGKPVLTTQENLKSEPTCG